MIAEQRLARAFLDAHPARAAMTLERMPVAHASAVLQFVAAPAAAAVLRDMNAPFAAECLTYLASNNHPSAAAAIVNELTVDDGAAIVRAMEPERREPLLAALPEAIRDPISRVLPYPDGTAGAVMDSAIFRLPDDVLVADARVRLAGAARELLYYLYVVDRNLRLVGVLDIPELLLARARDTVSVTMHREVQRVNVFMPVARVREHPGWHSYHALPVVDDDDKLVGAIRYQTLRRLEREASTGGVAPANVTAGALAELFQLGTSGLVAGLAATTAPDRDVTRETDVKHEEPDAT